MNKNIEPDEREEKLPRWAQDKLAALRSEWDDLQKRLAQAVDAPPSRVRVEPWSDQNGRPARYLGDRDTVRFVLNDNPDTLRSWVDVRLDGSDLRLMGGGSLVLRPHVTNVVYVDVER